MDSVKNLIVYEPATERYTGIKVFGERNLEIVMRELEPYCLNNRQ